MVVQHSRLQITRDGEPSVAKQVERPSKSSRAQELVSSHGGEWVVLSYEKNADAGVPIRKVEALRSVRRHVHACDH